MTTVIESAADLDALFDSIGETFYETPMRDFLELEVRRMEEGFNEQIRNSFDPNGNSLAPLAPSTIAKKGHDLILLDTGAFAQSLIHSGHENAIVEIIDEPGNAGVTRGTRDEKAPFHHAGTKHMPARPIVGFEPEEPELMAIRLADHVVENLKQGA